MPTVHPHPRRPRWRSLAVLALLLTPLLWPLQQLAERTLLENANRLLDQVRGQTGADVIYLMDPNGKTLAASNWEQADSFVDRHFAFRPSFREAIAGRPGR